MSRRSLESQRHIMAPSLSSARTSKRYSTYSCSPSFVTTSTTTGESGMSEIKTITEGISRLENKQLEQQRFVPTQKKSDELSKLNLGAKVERALGRRMANQDAVFKKRVKPTGPSLLSEKLAL